MTSHSVSIQTSLRMKLMAPLLLLGLASTVVSWMVIFQKMETNLDNRLLLRGRRTANAVRYAAENYQSERDLQRFVAAMAAENDIKLIVVAAGNPLRVVASTRYDWAGPPGLPVAQLPDARHIADDLERAIRTRQESTDLRHDADGTVDITAPIPVPIQIDGKRVIEGGAVMIHLDSSPVRREMLTVAWSIGLLLSAIIVFISLMSWLLMDRYVLRPTAIITRAMKSRGQGNPIAYAAVVAPDEIGQLAATFNAMVDHLAENDRQMRAMINNIPGAVYRCALDADWTMQWLNEAIFAVTGYPAEDFILNRRRSFASIIHAQDAQMVDFQVRKAVQERRPYELEYRIHHADGSIRWIYEKGLAVYDFSGKPVHLEGVILDESDRRRIEEELNVTRERWRLALSGSNDGVWDWNLQTNEVFFSTRWKQMLGYGEEEVEHHFEAWRRLIHPDDLEWIQREIQKHIEGKSEYYVAEHRLRCKDGTYKWILARGKMVCGQDGKPLRMIGSHTDMTERRRAEQQLREGEERLRLYAENTDDIISLADVHRKSLYVSPAYYRITGWTPEDVMQCDFIQRIHPEDRQAVEQARWKNLQGQATVLEWRGLKKNGGWLWFETTAKPLRDAEGKVIRIANTTRDITARKAADAEIRKLALIARETSSAVVLADDQGRIEWVNEAFTRITGYTLAESIGKSPNHLLNGPETDAATVSYMDECLAARRRFQVELLRYAKGGRKIWLQIEVQPMLDDQGRLQRFLGIVTDITERKNAEVERETTFKQMMETSRQLAEARDAASAANDAKTAFLANMSHEIRTPMTAILGHADLLLDGRLDPDHRLAHVQTIRRSGQHLLTIINDILDISRIEAGRMVVEPQDCSPVRIVEEVSSLMRPQAMEKHLEYRVEYIDKLPATIRTDPTRLRQILFNLVGNAVKFTRQGGVRLVVDCRREAEGDPYQMRFTVIDSGIGISESQIERLFQPFSQADNSTTRRFGGTGLGLAISKRLAEMLGGTITVQSRPDHGSTFTLRIDIGFKDSSTFVTPQHLRKEQMDLVESVSIPDVQTPLAGVHLLLAEDTPANQRFLAYILRMAGADVQLADNGRIAVEKVFGAAQSPSAVQAVILDMQMPEMDGYEAASELRRRGFAGPIIALTAHAMEGDREKCLSAGCDQYIPKPVDRNTLIATLLKIMEIKGGRANV